MKSVKLNPPWCTYANKLKALFNSDPDIEVSSVIKSQSDSCDYEVNIVVSDIDKYIALNKVLSPVVEFGNVKLRLVVLNNIDGEDSPYIAIYETIFKDNPLLKDIQTVEDQVGAIHAFIRFKPEVLQFYNDDLTDYNGNWSGLAQDIAREIFAENTDPFVNFCTADVREND